MKTHRVLSSRPALLGLVSTFAFLSSFSEACALGTTTPFYATIKNDSRGSEECLAFGGNGHDQNPQRITWGSGSHCGFDGRRDELLDNRQALWRFTPIGNGEYLIENASQGSYACLLFPANGSGSYPERYSWGPGEACGYAGGISALRQTRLGIWRLEPLGGDQYMMTNSSRNPDGECLIFSGNGSYIKPERFDWGPGDYCGFPGGKSALLANRQAVWKIEEVKVDDSPIPAAWENGYLLLQNVLHSNQILQQDPAGMGFFQVDWSEEDKNRFDVQPSGDGNFFFFENARSGRRMHVGHNGDGQLYSSFGGNDDAYKWTAERYQTGPETRYLFRNKLYPDQKLGVQTDGSGFPFAGTDHEPDSARYRWKVTTVVTASDPAHLTYEQYHVGRARQAYDLILQNKMYPNQRLHAGHDGNGQLYAEDGAYEDFTYRWIARKWGSTELITLSNRNRTYQKLFVGFPDGQPEARRMGILLNQGDFLWQLEPVEGNWFFLRNPITGKRLHVGHDGNGQLYTAAGQDDDAYKWRLIFSPGTTDLILNSDAECRSATKPKQIVIKVCFYDGPDQTGNRDCRIHDDVFPGLFKYFDERVRTGTITAAKSASAEDCNGSGQIDLFVYDEEGQKSDTTVIEGTGNLDGQVLGNARSYHVNPSIDYVCFYREDYQGGSRRSCYPRDQRTAKSLAGDWNDKVRSVKMFGTWICNGLDLWQHGPDGGQGINVASDENLKNRPFTDLSSSDPLEWVLAGNWANQVSGFRFTRPWWPCFG